MPTSPAGSQSAAAPSSSPSGASVSYDPSRARYDVPSNPGNPPAQYSSSSGSSGATGLQANVAGMLCYVLGLITGILFLVLEPYNRDRFVRFHAFQAILLHVAFIAAWIVLGILGAILPWGLGMIVTLGRIVVWLGGFGAWIYLMIKAYNNERYKLPIIGDIAEQQANK